MMSMAIGAMQPHPRPSFGERAVLYVATADEDVTPALRAFREARFPFEVVVARGYAESEEYLDGVGRYQGRNRLIAPLMVVIDLTDPAADGARLLRRLRGDRALRHVVAVLLTASDAETARLKRNGVGHDLYAEKPRDLAGFLVMARQMKTLLAHHGADV